MTELYDTIGHGYRTNRRPDRRIQHAILRALGDVSQVVNVGAGAGSYEPTDRFVVAVEPSLTMIQQRPSHAAPVVRASAAELPFRDAAFDAALAILTIHHWPDWRRGVQELARSARQRVVLLTWDPSAAGFWLVDDYFPEVMTLNRQIFPTIEELGHELGPLTVSPVPVPHDCTDGFLGAYWRRPEAYLEPSVRAAISTFAKVKAVEEGLTRLRNDLSSGEWHRRYGTLLSEEQQDLGYRLVVA